MKNIINSIVTFLIAIVGLIGGCIWIHKSSWDMEPIILTIVSLIEILGFLISKISDKCKNNPNFSHINSIEIQDKKLKNSKNKFKLSNFIELCQKISPILKDNKQIYLITAPNSSASEKEKIITDFTIWEDMKINKIIPNNELIRKYIETHKQLIPNKHEKVFSELLLHIDAFEKHVLDESFDYSEFQFPSTIESVTNNTCFEYTIKTRYFRNIRKWLNKRISKIDLILHYFLFGSSLVDIKNSNDIDLALFLSISKEEDKYILIVDKLERKFLKKFRKKLDITIFNESEKVEYERFKKVNCLRVENG